MVRNPRKFSLRSRLRSFKYAFSGLWALLVHEHNSRIHFTAAILAVAMGFILHISRVEWSILVGIIALVVVVEILNSAIERLADHVSPQVNPAIKMVKDYSAAAVLIASLAAVIIGCIIFLPKLLNLLSH